MKLTISNNTIKQLQAQAKQYDVRDTKLKGFLIRVNPSGKMQYVCEYGRGKRINIGPVGVITPAQARDSAKEIIGQATKGIDPTSAKRDPSKISLKKFIESTYLPWVLQHRKDGIRTVARVRRCFYRILGKRPLIEITALRIEQWQTQRLKAGRSPVTVNRDIVTFKAALSKAVDWGFLKTHPLKSLKLLKVDNNPKVRYLNIDEENRLLAILKIRDGELQRARQSGNQWREERGYPLYPTLDNHTFADHMTPMIMLAMLTGLRQGELFNLTWDNVDLKSRLITVSGTIAKSGRTRHIPLNNLAIEILQAWSQQTTKINLVFPSQNGKPFNNVRKAWETIRKRSNIEYFRWHDLRHHFASKLVMAGVDLNTVRELLGHSDIKMTLRYAHLASEHKAHAVQKLEFSY